MEIELIRLAISVVAAAVATALLVQIAGAAPLSTNDWDSADLALVPPTSETISAIGSPMAAQHLAPGDAVPPADDSATIDPVSGWFDVKKFEPIVSDDHDKINADPTTCNYADSYLRSLGQGRDDCLLLKPVADQPEILSLPFVVLSAWALVILAVAGLYYFYGNWRLRRWLRRMRAQGFALKPPRRRNAPAHKTTRASSRPKSRHPSDPLPAGVTPPAKNARGASRGPRHAARERASSVRRRSGHRGSYAPPGTADE